MRTATSETPVSRSLRPGVGNRMRTDFVPIARIARTKTPTFGRRRAVTEAAPDTRIRAKAISMTSVETRPVATRGAATSSPSTRKTSSVVSPRSLPQKTSPARNGALRMMQDWDCIRGRTPIDSRPIELVKHTKEIGMKRILAAAAMSFLFLAAAPARAQFPSSVPDTFRLKLGGMYAWFDTDVTFQETSPAVAPSAQESISRMSSNCPTTSPDSRARVTGTSPAAASSTSATCTFPGRERQHSRGTSSTGIRRIRRAPRSPRR